MISAEMANRDSSQPLVRDDGQRHTPHETFELSEPDLEDGVSQSFKRGWRGRWSKKSRAEHDEDQGEEAVGLLPVWEGLTGKTDTQRGRSYSHWCIYGCNTALGISISLIMLNLLFGFATFLQLPKQPGTTSEEPPWYSTVFLRDVVPIPCHSHNDYWRKVPLFSALYHGCIGVEADVWAIDDELFVGHNTASLTANRTFQSMYINPLVDILERQNLQTPFYNGTSHGVFDTSAKQSLTLLVDIKTDGAAAWPLVLRQLEPLRQRGWLAYVDNGILYHRPITVVGTGKTPFNLVTANETYRDIFFDAPLDEMANAEDTSSSEPSQPGLGNINDVPSNETLPQGQGASGTSPSDVYNKLNSYYASTSFTKTIGTVRGGKLSNEQIKTIRQQIRGAHHRGLKARYWNLPAWPISYRNYVWDVLVKEGIDLLNVDDLEAAGNGVW